MSKRPRRDPRRPSGRGRARRTRHPAARHNPTRPARSKSTKRTRKRSRRGARRYFPRNVATVGVLAVVALAGLGWLLLAGPLLVVRNVEVTGTVALDAARVREAAAVPAGANLLLLDVEAIEARIEKLSRVADAEVDRSVTGTVELSITERVPIAVVPTGGGARLVDATGTAFATVAEPPADLPVLRVPRVGPSAPAAVAATTVLARLPDWLYAKVQAVRASSRLEVRLELTGDRTVRWGSPAQSRRKAAVLKPLLTRPGDVYDVASPDLPTVS